MPRVPSDPLSKRDRATLHRILRKFSDAELDVLIAQERSRLAGTTKIGGGAPRSPKGQQALLVALYLARCCRGSISVRSAAQEIYDVVEIKIIRPKKHGLPSVRSMKSVRAIQEDLRVGLSRADPQAFATTIFALVSWRCNHKNPTWPAGAFGTAKQSVSFIPKKPAKLIRWIDALMTVFSDYPLIKSAAEKIVTP
jgi:hypothetical protein